jgi:hypothetical protein
MSHMKKRAITHFVCANIETYDTKRYITIQRHDDALSNNKKWKTKHKKVSHLHKQFVSLSFHLSSRNSSLI